MAETCVVSHSIATSGHRRLKGRCRRVGLLFLEPLRRSSVVFFTVVCSTVIIVHSCAIDSCSEYNHFAVAALPPGVTDPLLPLPVPAPKHTSMYISLAFAGWSSQMSRTGSSTLPPSSRRSASLDGGSS